MKKLLILEDDPFLAESISEIVQEFNVPCTTFLNVRDIEKHLLGKAPGGLIVDLQIPINGSKLISNHAARGGFLAGQAVLRFAKHHWPKTPMALMTGNPSNEIRKWCLSNDIEYFIKPIERSTLERFVGARSSRAFIVHGRNMSALRSVKAALRTFRIKPVVLMECASLGRTVIEKFEEVSNSCDCAIVIVSPDDIGRLKDVSADSDLFRARQNVLFELGYFYGALGRRNGIVLLVEYGKVEIPSDLAGIIRLNGKVTRAKLHEKLKEELAYILP
jgi:predicted nucleotide-binding protein